LDLHPHDRPRPTKPNPLLRVLQSNVAKPPPAAEHEAEPHHHVAGEPLSIDDDGSLAGGVDGTFSGGVEEDLVEREVGEGDRSR
jgi:hypothetical protein